MVHGVRMANHSRRDEPLTTMVHRRIAARTWAALIAFAALLNSCAGSSSDEPTVDPTSGAVSPEQSEAIADGVITQAEYEKAVFATVQCLIDAGVRIVGEPAYDEETGTRLSFEWDGGPTMEESLKTNELYFECKRTHSGAVESLWAAQNEPSEAELNAARKALGDCLRIAGVPGVPPNPSSEDFVPFIQHPAFEGCAAEAAREYRVPNFFG